MDVREKLVELIEQSGACFDCFPVAGYEKDEIEKIASHLISHSVTVQEWISVKDVLPEDDEQIEFYDDGRIRLTTVLAYTEYGRIIPKNRFIVRPTGNEYLDKQVTNGWIWAIRTEEVTYWMPLPDAPKEDRNG